MLRWKGALLLYITEIFHNFTDLVLSCYDISGCVKTNQIECDFCEEGIGNWAD